MDADEARTIGRRVRMIRDAREKSPRVVVGMSTTHLWRIEHGERALDLMEIIALPRGAADRRFTSGRNSPKTA